MRTHPLIRVANVLALTAALVLTTIGMADAGVSRAWTHQFGRDSTDIARGVAIDGDRNVFVAGRITTDRGDDCFVRKYLPDGRRRWMRIIGTARGDWCRGVAVARNGSIYVAGDTYGNVAGTSAGSRDGFLRKYRPDGSVAWTRQFGSSGSEQVYAVAVDDAGNVLVAGHTSGALGSGTNRGGWDGFVRKFRSSGRHVWTRQFGTTVDDFALDVAVDSSRQVIVSGETFGSLGAPHRGAGDAYVRKLRPNGDHRWTRQFGTPAKDSADDVAVNADDRIYVAGRTEGALPGQTSSGMSDGFVRKLRPDGSSIWTHQFGTPDPDWARSVTVDRAGRVYVAGASFVTSYDAYLMKMKPDGSGVWARKTGTGATYDEAWGVAVDQRRHVYIVGRSDGALAGQTWAGGYDAWIRKYRP